MWEKCSINTPTTLVVGLDDSNHAGLNKKGEIIVATFSTIPDDGLVVQQHNRRDVSEAEKWFERSGRDYLFTILTYEGQSSLESLLHQPYNLVVVAPIFVETYLRKHPELDPGALKIFLDGTIKGEHRRFIKKSSARI